MSRTTLVVLFGLVACVEPDEPLTGSDQLDAEGVVIGGALEDHVLAAAFAPDGRTLLVTRTEGGLMVGGAPIPGAEASVIIAFDVDTRVELAVQTPTALEVVRAAATPGDAWIVSAGFSRELVRPGGGTIEAESGFDTILLALGRDGAPIAELHVAATGDAFVNALVADDGGAVYAAGRFAGTLFAGGVRIDAAGGDDAFVMKLSPALAVEWIVPFASRGRETTGAMALRLGGGVVVYGSYGDLLQVGEYELAAPPSPRPFFAELDDTGRVVVALAIDGADRAELSAAATDLADTSGARWVAGTFTNEMTIAGRRLASRGQIDVFVAHGEDAIRIGGPLLDVVEGVALDPGRGWLWLIGSERSGDGLDAFLVALGMDLSEQLRLDIGGGEDQIGAAVGVLEDGSVAFVGEMNGPLELPDTAVRLEPVGASDIFRAILRL